MGEERAASSIGDESSTLSTGTLFLWGTEG